MTSIDRKMAKLNVKFNLRCMLCIQLINSMKSRYTIRWLRTLSIFWFMAKAYMLSEPSLMWVFIWFCISQCNEHSNFGTWFSLHIFISQINNNRAVETSNCGCNPFMTLTKLVHKHMHCAYDSAEISSIWWNHQHTLNDLWMCQEERSLSKMISLEKC